MRIMRFVAAAALLATVAACSSGTTKVTEAAGRGTSVVHLGADGSTIDPANFTTKIDNPYFPLIPGSRWEYEKSLPEGLERIEFVVTDEIKKTNMGVETVVVHDTVFLDDVIIEDTWDWYAQDDAGNVWYFGEDTHEFEKGRPVNSSGAWEAGVDGARPGIYMPADPKLGEGPYKQESYKGEAEDTGEVVGVNKTVKVPFGTFKNVVETEDVNPLSTDGVVEHKFYAKGIGMVLEEEVKGGDERTELVDFKKG